MFSFLFIVPKQVACIERVLCWKSRWNAINWQLFRRCFVRFEQFADVAHSPCTTAYFPSWLDFISAFNWENVIDLQWFQRFQKSIIFIHDSTFFRSLTFNRKFSLLRATLPHADEWLFCAQWDRHIGRFCYSDRLPRHFGRHRENERKPENKFKDQRPNTTKTDKFYFLLCIFVLIHIYGAFEFEFMYSIRRWRREGKRLVVHSNLVIFFTIWVWRSIFVMCGWLSDEKSIFLSFFSVFVFSVYTLVWNIDHTKSDLCTNGK